MRKDTIYKGCKIFLLVIDTPSPFQRIQPMSPASYRHSFKMSGLRHNPRMSRACKNALKMRQEINFKAKEWCNIVHMIDIPGPPFQRIQLMAPEGAVSSCFKFKIRQMGLLASQLLIIRKSIIVRILQVQNNNQIPIKYNFCTQIHHSRWHHTIHPTPLACD